MAKTTRTGADDIKRAVRRAERAKKAEGVSVGMLFGGLALFYLVMKAWANWKKAHAVTEVTI